LNNYSPNSLTFLCINKGFANGSLLGATPNLSVVHGGVGDSVVNDRFCGPNEIGQTWDGFGKTNPFYPAGAGHNDRVRICSQFTYQASVPYCPTGNKGSDIGLPQYQCYQTQAPAPCPSGYTYNSSNNICEQRTVKENIYTCPSSYVDIGGTPPCIRYVSPISTCLAGFTYSGTQCEQRIVKENINVCPSGYTDDGGTPPCIRYTPASGSNCPTGYTLNGVQCEQRTTKENISVCPSGYTDDGGTPPCVKVTVIGSRTITVAPTAGYFGFPTNSASPQDFEMGKKHYLHLVECSEYSSASNISTFNINSAGRLANTGVFNVPSITASCVSPQTINNANVQSLDILANRYLHLVECFQTYTNGDIQTFNTSVPNQINNTIVNNLASITPSCTSNKPINSSSVETINLFGNRYLHLVECFESSVAGDKNTFNIDSPNRSANTTANNNPTFTPICSSPNSITQSVVGNFDMLDTSRGYGYIEYKMTSNQNAFGLYGTNASLTGNFGNVISGGENSIDIITCSSRYPNNWQINLTLTDAELRSDQDFTCNYQPKICPIVFYDLNADGIQSTGEGNVSGQTISLYRENGIDLVSSIITDTAGNTCFNSIAGGGNIYKIIDPNPLTIYNTTGGQIRQVSVASNNVRTNVKFGYTNGILTLATPPSVSFPTINTSSSPQTVCTSINPIVVLDTRISQTGWSVTGVVDNFYAANNNNTLSVVNKFRSSPGSVSVISGLTGPQGGVNKTVTATDDAFTVFSVNSGQGRGNYSINQDICQDLDPYTATGSYTTVITYTII
ncbi:MAG: hypothetical protein H7196_01610, partial [candidate division SR1 bacterium]|nr:hypothetical protein [candidate division SR1 bacterium]